MAASRLSSPSMTYCRLGVVFRACVSPHSIALGTWLRTSRSIGTVEGAEQAAASGPALGQRVEPGADRWAAADRVPR
jgi:hypothetical protein